MNKKKWVIGLVSTMSLALALTGCGSSGKPADQGNQGAPKTGDKPSQLVIATGGTSGTYYPLGGGIMQILKDKANLASTVQTTGAAVENMRLIKDGQADLALTQGDIAQYAADGTMMFKEKGAIKNFRLISALYPETVQIVVPSNSPIKTVADLKGKKVSVGAPGSGTEANAQQILEMYGLKFEDVNVQRLSFGESTNGLKDGGLDAAFVTAGFPTSAVSELGATKGVRVLDVDEEHAKKLIEKYPYYSGVTIPAKTYTGQDQDVKAVAVKSVLIARAELDDQLVYDITKAFFENLNVMGNVHAKGKEISLEKALEGTKLEVHPGAAKYLTEKGIIK